MLFILSKTGGIDDAVDKQEAADERRSEAIDTSETTDDLLTSDSDVASGECWSGNISNTS
jgi:hypothetical protein